jgi:SAM-dependent methyltransferase
LDCGCGSGGYVLRLFEYSRDVFGVDYDENKVRTFRALNIYPDHVVQGDIEELAFQDEQFDVVLLNEVLEHIPNESNALRQVHRVLKKNGILVLFTPNRLYPFETHRVLRVKNNHLIPHYFPFIPYIPLRIGSRIFAYNARNYFPWELKRKLTRQDFTIVKHTFIWQTFENISGHFVKSGAAKAILRRISFTLEKIPVINRLGISQVLIAKKL